MRKSTSKTDGTLGAPTAPGTRNWLDSQLSPVQYRRDPARTGPWNLLASYRESRGTRQERERERTPLGRINQGYPVSIESRAKWLSRERAASDEKEREREREREGATPDGIAQSDIVIDTRLPLHRNATSARITARDIPEVTPAYRHNRIPARNHETSFVSARSRRRRAGRAGDSRAGARRRERISVFFLSRPTTREGQGGDRS